MKPRKLLKQLRLGRNLTQAQTAAAVSISPSYYGMIERGERNPTLEDAKRLADFFGISIDLLFFGNLSYKSYKALLMKNKIPKD